MGRRGSGWVVFGGLDGRDNHVTWEQQVSYLRATELQQNLKVERRMYTYPIVSPALYGPLLPDFALFSFCDGIVVVVKRNGGRVATQEFLLVCGLDKDQVESSEKAKIIKVIIAEGGDGDIMVSRAMRERV